MEVIYQLMDNLGLFLLVFARVVGMFVTAPVFNFNNIPINVKIGLSLIFTFIIFPILKIPENIIIDQIFLLVIASTKELITGMMIGFLCYLFLSCVYLAGHIIDMGIGFSMASVINPQDDSETPIMANLLYFMAILVFLAINGHHVLIRALVQSFDFIPLNALGINMFMIDKLIGILQITFIISFKVGAPVLAAIFITNVLLGILARTMPQMNVFVVGMPLKILIGLIVIIAISPIYVGFFEYIFDSMFENLKDFMSLVTKG